MPLLISPVDGQSMRKVHRYGIEIDVCPASGGIWLDHGELEKLVDLIREDTAREIPARQRLNSGRDDWEEDRRLPHRDDRRFRLLDLFDF